MSYYTCSVPDCIVTFADGGILHSYPNPYTDQERFQAWINNVGGEVTTLDPSYVFKNRRICHTHFENKYYSFNNRLFKTAVPTLKLPEKTPASAIALEVTYQAVAQNVPSASCSTTGVYNMPVIPSTSEDQILPAITAQPRPLQKTPASAIALEVTYQAVAQNVPSASCSTIGVYNMPVIPSTSEDQILPAITAQPRPLRNTCDSLTHQESNLVKMIKNLKNEVKRNKMARQSIKQRLLLARKSIRHDAMKLLSQKMTKTAKTFLALQVTQAGKKAKGRRFTLKEKILALSLYKPSPKAYRILSTICILPKAKTLSTLLQKVALKPGINNNLFSDLQKKAEKLQRNHKFCTLIFDEMSISPNVTYDQKNDEIIGFTDNGERRTTEFCDHALVFMVRGVIKKYKQPVAYVFSNGNLKSYGLASIIKTIISKVQETGLKVVATVCDQAAVNMAAINILLDQTREEYLRKGVEYKGAFFHVENKDKIVPIYDPPHLMKGVRNNLLTKNLEFTAKGKVCIAKWQHIIDLYKRGLGYNGVRLVPKLTAHHVYPELIPKMRVKMCTQVFSCSVGVALGFMADAGKLPKESKDTADLLLLFDNIFDSVNGCSSKIVGGKFLRSAVTPTSRHHKLWQEAIPIIKSMKYVDANGKASKVPSLTSWVKTIEGFKMILKDLSRSGLNSILLRNFNQDPIENFFGAIRAHGHHNIMPNAAAFQAAYKTLLINNMTSPHSIGANCEKDDTSCLITSLENFFDNVSKTNVIKVNNVLEEHLVIEPINIDVIIKSNDNVDKERCAAIAYCSGWLIMKVRKVTNNCINCKNTLESDKIEIFHTFIKMSEYNNKDWLCYPTKQSFNFFAQSEHITQMVLKKYANINNISEYLKLLYVIHLDTAFIACHLHKENVVKFILDKTALFNLFSWCKNINKIITGKEVNYDQSDEMQMAALEYYKKYKTRKRLIKSGRELRL